MSAPSSINRSYSFSVSISCEKVSLRCTRLRPRGTSASSSESPPSTSVSSERYTVTSPPPSSRTTNRPSLALLLITPVDALETSRSAPPDVNTRTHVPGAKTPVTQSGTSSSRINRVFSGGGSSPFFLARFRAFSCRLACFASYLASSLAKSSNSWSLRASSSLISMSVWISADAIFSRKSSASFCSNNCTESASDDFRLNSPVSIARSSIRRRASARAMIFSSTVFGVTKRTINT
mmetsp:Transcript_57988/g.136680  ORF Transcript_57988/g.136680 Transcript_57988/m.136680 type:complete len:236 (+) Transcript_57988:546-1253(+)